MSQLAEAENADTALGRVLLVELEPDPAFLACAIIEVLAMQPQHLKDDVLAHRIRHVWIDETDDRYAARQVGVDEDMVDPGAEGEDQLQVRQGRQQSGLGAPNQSVIDFRRIADLGPYPHLELRHQPGQMRLPARLGID